ncbi:MAG TPA: hypothetical protein VH684_18705 [Xanthobacteraceae bacterium]
MNRKLLGAFTLATVCILGFATDRSVAKDDGKAAAMRFEWRREGPADECGQFCRRWISAAGIVSESTARDFEAFAKESDVRGATLVLDSEGGSVLAALALGRAIRRFDMTTAVGKTIPLPSADGGAARATLSPKAQCESMCAFILLGGARRYVPPEARVLVHQIWLGSKSKRALESSYSAEELRLVERDIGSLARYTVEMGAGIELLETALRIPPWEPMYSLSREELRRMQIVTVERLFDEGIPTASMPTGKPESIATTAQAQ